MDALEKCILPRTNFLCSAKHRGRASMLGLGIRGLLEVAKEVLMVAEKSEDITACLHGANRHITDHEIGKRQEAIGSQ